MAAQPEAAALEWAKKWQKGRRMTDWQEPWTVFALAAALSGTAGMARQLASRRSRKDLCDVAAGSLYSAVWGLGISLVWYEQFRTNVHTLLGGCILAALAGTLSAQEVLSWLRVGLKAVDSATTARRENRRKQENEDDVDS